MKVKTLVTYPADETPLREFDLVRNRAGNNYGIVVYDSKLNLRVLWLSKEDPAYQGYGYDIDSSTKLKKGESIILEQD